MTQNTSFLANWFITDDNRTKAHLKEVLQSNQFDSCVSVCVECMNQHSFGTVELSQFFHEWDNIELQAAIELSTNVDWVDLINAIFFYKLYPEKLFDELVHPEKLVSVTMRLNLLHNFIESLFKEINIAATQHGLNPGIDYLFHGDELPQGIMIEVREEYKKLITSAIKQLKVIPTPENEAFVTLDILHDISRAYKFWFNPNRLVDAVMVLQQRLVSSRHPEGAVFKDKMTQLYSQLTTTECLDLYGYFANDDSRYLIFTLYTILQNYPLDWIPVLRENEKRAVGQVHEALNNVMEALRDELKYRHVTTEPYCYDLAAEYIQAGRRSREAVFRIIAIYGADTISQSNNLEQLFNNIEES